MLGIDEDKLFPILLDIDEALHKYCRHSIADEEEDHKQIKFSDKCILANAVQHLNQDFFILTFDYDDFVYKLDGIIDQIKTYYFVFPAEKKHQYRCENCYLIKYKNILSVSK